MKHIKTLAILNFIVYLAACLVSNLSQLKIIGGKTMGDVSDKYATVFTPAGITFTIWGVIYISLFGFTIYHLVMAFKEDENSEANQTLKKIQLLFLINNVAIFAWVFAFLNEYLGVSVVLMFIQLITLLMIFIKLNIFDIHKSFNNKLFIQFPLSIYFSWICVAAIANTSAYLVSIGFKGINNLNEMGFAVVMISIAISIAFYITWVKRNPYFALVTAWALYGIQLKRTEVNEQIFETIIELCWFGIGALAVVVLSQWFKNIKNKAKLSASN